MSTREILFRGKRADNAEWIEGYYMYHINRTICSVGDSIKPDDVEHIILFDGFSDWNMPRGINYKHVLPETVCRYTGLTDKNGRKIFEGDILSGERYHDSGQGGKYVPDKCAIKWDEKRAAFDPVYWWEGYNHDLKHYEVIGNIFDNPELLN